MYIDKLKAVVQRMNQNAGRVMIDNDPYTLEEIRCAEEELGIKFPRAYEEYLLWNGGSRGIFLGDYAYGNGTGENRETAIEILQECRIPQDTLPDDSVVFVVNHQGYCFAFFRLSEGENPPIHFFLEPALGIQWNYAKNIEDYCLKRILDRYRNLATDALSALDTSLNN